MAEHLMTKELLLSLLNVIDEGIHVIDTNGYTVFYNEVAARHDGMKIKEVEGKHLLEAFPSLTKKTSTLMQVLKQGRAIWDKSQSYVNYHGIRIDTVNTTLPIYSGDKMLGAVEVAKDLTRLRRLSERLLELERKSAARKAEDITNQGAVYHFDDIQTINKSFLEIIEQGKKAAQTESSIFVHGESGTGKELFVQGIHNASKRSDGAFIAQNCAALPESLLESILFGTVKGSYTGAVDRPGLFESADGGTLFLDEIQSMSPALQSKLLRVLEDGKIRRVGSANEKAVDVRVIAASNMHPEEALEEKVIRPDLYYRLHVIGFHLPSLRERKEDIPFLCQYFIRLFNEKSPVHVVGLSPSLEEHLIRHPWNGNVRELKHCMEYMMNMADKPILDNEHLPALFPGTRTKVNEIPPLRTALKETEERLVERALEMTDGNVKRAAELLQIPRQTLQYKMRDMH